MRKLRAANWWNCGGRGPRAAHQKPSITLSTSFDVLVRQCSFVRSQRGSAPKAIT